MSINRVVLSGNLTRDPELRSTQSGMPVLGFGIAVNDRRKNPQTNEWEDYPNFIDCTIFGARGEALSKYLSKGTKVSLEGKLRWSQWERDGQKRSKIEVIVDELEFMSARNSGAGSSAGADMSSQAAPASVPSVDVNSSVYDDLRDIFNAFVRFGGMPGIADVGLNQEKALALLDGIYSTVVVRDILDRKQRSGQRQLTDPTLLRKIVLFLADNIGSNISASSIGNTLINEGLLEDTKRTSKPSTHTVQAYVNALTESYFFYEIKRFDIKGKEYLRTLGKYYIVDVGLRNYLLGFRDRDSGHVLENIVYFELLRRGYDVAIGKIDNAEIDFVAVSADDKKYIQVTESMQSESVRKRELAPLQKIRDNYEKIVLTLDKGLDDSYDGIKSENLINWLLSD